MTLEEAIGWCVKEMATVHFSMLYGDPRVTVVPCGFIAFERSTFLEAVEAAKDRVESFRRAMNEEL